MKPNVYIYILVMAGVTYLIRMLPLALAKKEITNPFIKSFLFYVPYACLAAMTFPAILSATASVISAVVGFVVALIAAYKREESADCGASCLWCSIYCRKNNGLCGVSITKCLQSARAPFIESFSKKSQINFPIKYSSRRTSHINRSSFSSQKILRSPPRSFTVTG